jgi:hypothetical protein
MAAFSEATVAGTHSVSVFPQPANKNGANIKAIQTFLFISRVYIVIANLMRLRPRTLKFLEGIMIGRFGAFV